MDEARTPEQRLAERGLEPPAPPTAVAAYRPHVLTGTAVNGTGQLTTTRDGQLVARGRLGAEPVEGAGRS